MGKSTDSDTDKANATPVPPLAANPAGNGRGGKLAVALMFGLMALFALFLCLDTIQFAITGHESSTFTAVTRGIGGLGIGALLVTLAMSWFKQNK